jgi:type I restriction enzyme S subunit
MKSESAKATEERSPWQVTRLLDVTRHHSGNSKLIKGKLFDAPGESLFPAFSASGQDVWRQGYESEGDAIIVSAVGARCGKAFLASGKWSAIANTHVVWPQPDKIDRKFLWYKINAERFWIRSGTAQPFVVVRKTFERPFALPPLDEQQRIVAEIEKQFTRLDAGVTSLKRVQTALKRYRASVLKAACEGRLVRTEAELARKENRSYETGEQLLQRILEERRAKWNGKGEYKEPRSVGNTDMPKLSEGWAWCMSDAVFVFVTSGSRGWAKYYSEAGPIFLRIGNLNHEDIRLDLSDLQHVTPPGGAEGTRTAVEPNDILISITADVGMVALVPEKLGESYINQHVALARPACSVCAEYIAYYLSGSEGGWRQLKKLQRGATKVGLGLDDIRSVPIPLPPLAEQKRIVAEVEAKLSIVDELEMMATSQFRRIARLRQSILQQAFEGKLTEKNNILD